MGTRAAHRYRTIRTGWTGRTPPVQHRPSTSVNGIRWVWTVSSPSFCLSETSVRPSVVSAISPFHPVFVPTAAQLIQPITLPQLLLVAALISPSAAAQHPTIQPIVVSQQPTAPTQTRPPCGSTLFLRLEWRAELLTDLNPQSKLLPLPPPSPALQTFKTWEPNETRLNMLKGYPFVFVGEKGLEKPVGYRHLVNERGCCALAAEDPPEGKGISGGEEQKGGSRGKWLRDGGAGVCAEEWKKIDSVAKSWSLSNPRTFCAVAPFVDTFFVDSARTAARRAKAYKKNTSS
ncbi:hypothetical protein BC826DRAFT_972986 [Russula brevipes]|nr:hypothetical protein BC826DRAFT_972986 [Russula brevipes]